MGPPQRARTTRPTPTLRQRPHAPCPHESTCPIAIVHGIAAAWVMAVRGVSVASVECDLWGGGERRREARDSHSEFGMSCTKVWYALAAPASCSKVGHAQCEPECGVTRDAGACARGDSRGGGVQPAFRTQHLRGVPTTGTRACSSGFRITHSINHAHPSAVRVCVTTSTHTLRVPCHAREGERLAGGRPPQLHARGRSTPGRHPLATALGRL